jgi:hypothetical protein
MTAPVPLASQEESPATLHRMTAPTGLRLGAWLPTWALITTKHLELRKRRGLMIAIAVLVLALPVLLLGLRLLFHLIDPAKYAPAGSPSIFSSVSNVLAEFGFIAAATLGAAAATTDLSEGMFRHLVITGRSRLALYLARIPAGLAIILPVAAAAFTMLCLVTSYEGIAGPGNPAINEMFKIGLWLELEVGIGFLAGLGLGSLTGQRTLTTVLLIALEIIVTPILAAHVIPYFLDGQRLVVGIAMDQLRPAALGAGNLAGGGPGGSGPGGPGHIVFGGRGALGIPPMPTWAMICVIVGWAVGWSGIGAWRMATRDA